MLDLDPTPGVVRVAGGTSLDDLLRAIVPLGLVRAASRRAPGSSPSAAPSPRTSTARTTTPTAPSAPTSARWCSPARRHDADAHPRGHARGVLGDVRRHGPHRARSSRPPFACQRDRDEPPRRRHRPGRRPRRPPRPRCATARTSYRYSVAWIDLLARGRHLGRSVLTQGDFAPGDALAGDRRQRDPLALRAPARRAGAARRRAACSTGSRSGAFNELWFRKAPGAPPGRAAVDHHVLPPARHGRRVEPAVRRPRLPPVAVPAALRRGGRAARAASRRCAGVRAPSFLAVLKTFGAADPAPAVVPGPGLDARPRRARRGRPSSPALLDRPRPRASSTPAGASTSPRTAGCARSWCRPCTPASTSGGPSATGSTPTAASTATSPAASASSGDPSVA